MANENRRVDHVERHVVTLICSLTAIGVVWIASSIVDMKTIIAGLSEKFALRSDLYILQVEVARVATEQARRTAIIDDMKKQRK